MTSYQKFAGVMYRFLLIYFEFHLLHLILVYLVFDGLFPRNLLAYHNVN